MLDVIKRIVTRRTQRAVILAETQFEVFAVSDEDGERRRMREVRVVRSRDVGG